jgi:hypothetical protein
MAKAVNPHCPDCSCIDNDDCMCLACGEVCICQSTSPANRQFTHTHTHTHTHRLKQPVHESQLWSLLCGWPLWYANKNEGSQDHEVWVRLAGIPGITARDSIGDIIYCYNILYYRLCCLRLQTQQPLVHHHEALDGGLLVLARQQHP